MNIHTLHPPAPPQVADWTDVAALQQRLAETVEAMNGMAAGVGLAKHILEFSGDQRKRALARAMAPALAGGSSVAKAEAEARADDRYGRELDVLGKQHAAAEQTVMEWEAKKLMWQTSQSLLALQREGLKQL